MLILDWRVLERTVSFQVQTLLLWKINKTHTETTEGLQSLPSCCIRVPQWIPRVLGTAESASHHNLHHKGRSLLLYHRFKNPVTQDCSRWQLCNSSSPSCQSGAITAPCSAGKIWALTQGTSLWVEPKEWASAPIVGQPIVRTQASLNIHQNEALSSLISRRRREKNKKPVFPHMVAEMKCVIWRSSRTSPILKTHKYGLALQSARQKYSERLVSAYLCSGSDFEMPLC